MDQISRRSFLKGVAASAVGLSVMNGVALAEGKEEIQWDDTYDVVVLGFGAAGATAAITAADDGARVLICEKAPAGSEGGNSKRSGQGIMGTDDHEQLAQYLKALMGKFTNWNETMVDVYAIGAQENFDWFVSLGADPNKLKNNFGREGFIWVWNEFPELPGSDHCICWMVNGTNFDAGFYNLLHSNVANRPENITVMNDAPGKHIIRGGENNEVLGVQIEKDGKLMNIRATGGVVIATGGFEANNEMMASFLQQPYAYVYAAKYNTGDGIKMAMEAGADLWHMSNSAGYLWGYRHPGSETCVVGVQTKLGVLVGCNGSRFMREDYTQRHGRVMIGGRWMSMPCPLPAYLVVDSEQIGNKLVSSFSEGNADEIAQGLVLKADTLEELAQKMGGDVKADILVASIADYNKAYDEGRNADYGRALETMVPVRTGPFYAIEIGPTMYNTQGGARRNYNAQILDTNGQIIPGLFSCGEMGSMFCDMYNGGGNLGECAIYGRIAGHNAARGLRTEDAAPTTTIFNTPKATGSSVIEEKLVESTGKFKPGTYTAQQKGMDTVTVTVTFDETKITDVQISGPGETVGIGDKAIEQLPGQILEAQSANVDGVSGATITSSAIRQAVSDCIAQAQQI